MAEEYVVKEQLTQEMIEAGVQVTLKLDEIGLPVTAALWFLDDERYRWKMIVASPDTSTKGPFYVLTRIEEALDLLGSAVSSEVPFSVMSAKSPTDSPIRWLREELQTGNDISRIRFRKRVAAGHIIEDALIYRMS